MAGARYVLLLFFGHADFANDADFSSWDYFVPQISQIYTDFSSWDYFCPTDFTDIHRFFSSEGFSSDFTDESEAALLIGLLTDFRRTLAAGQWLAPYICSCFLSHRFHRFLFLRILLISRNTLIINIVLDIT